MPRHIGHVLKALSKTAKVTVVSDQNRGGYDAIIAQGADHIILEGLQSRASLPHLWRSARGLWGLLSKQDADLVWLHARLPVLLGRVLLMLRLWRPSGAVALTYHGLPFGPGHRPWASRISLFLETVLLRFCPPLDLIFLTEAMRRQLIATLGPQTRHRLHVLGNCSDLEPVSSAAPRPGRHLVMTGRVGFQKNYLRALDLMAHLPKDITLTLCGAGTDRPEFAAQIAARVPAGVQSRVRVLGPVRDVRPVLAEADGYLLCSRYEGQPIGALEAFEAGLPIFLSRFEGAQELVAAHPFGVLLPEDGAVCAAEIDATLNRYLQDPDAARTAIQTVWRRHWSVQAFTQACQSLVAKILTTRR